MQSLHNNLRKLMPWYDEWHNHPRHKHAHWFILFVIGLLITTAVFSQILSIYFENLVNAEAQTGNLPAPNTIQLAPILSSWTEPTGNGWWPHLSPDGKYVSYGNNSSKITDIATKQTWDFSSTGPQCYGAYWLNSTKATFTCSTGNTTADRYEVMAGVWNAVKTSDNPSLVAGNKFEANNDHWASWLSGGGRIAKDNQLLTNNAGLIALDGDTLLASCDLNNSSLCVWKDALKVATHIPSIPINEWGIRNDHIIYGNYGPSIRGICPNGTAINIKASTINEGIGDKSRPIFMKGNETWVATSAYPYILIRKFGDTKSIVVEASASNFEVLHIGNTFVIAYSTGTGQLTVLTIPDNSPLNDLSGGRAPETCGSIITPTPIPTNTPIPLEVTGPNPCPASAIIPEVLNICDFSPNIGKQGDTIEFTGNELASSIIQLTNRSTEVITDVTPSIDSNGMSGSFDIPSAQPDGEYVVSIYSSTGTATTPKILTVDSTYTPPSTEPREPAPFPPAAPNIPAPKTPSTFQELIGFVFQYAIYLVGIAVFIAFLWGGFLWMTSAANPANIGRAKSMMTNAIIGAILLVSSYVILYTINPELVGGTFTLPGIKNPTAVGTIVQPTCTTSGVCSNNSTKACTQDTDCNAVCIANACNNGKVGSCTYDTDCQLAPRYIAATEAEAAEAFSIGCARVPGTGYQDFIAIECPSASATTLTLDPVFQAEDADVNNQVFATAVHTGGNTGQGRKIVVLDSGYNRGHDDLKSSYGGGWDFINNDNDPSDDWSSAHGSHVSGIITADGVNPRARGVAPDAQIIAGKIINSNGDVNYSDIVTGIYWAINGQDGVFGTADDFKPDAINISIGGGSYANFCDNATDNLGRPIATAIQYARDRGTLVVVAAGNKIDGPYVSIPGCIDKAFTVGNVNSNNVIAGNSGEGAGVDVVAPGVNIYSTMLGNSYNTKSGTSMATPVVAGIAALIKAAHPNYTVDELERVIISTARDFGASGKDVRYGWGLATADGAISGGPIPVCQGGCASVNASPASCTRGTVASNPNCNINISYSMNGIAPADVVIKRNGLNWVSPTSTNGSRIESNPSAGTWSFTVNNRASGLELARTVVYIYNTGSLYTDKLSCTIGAEPANLNCNVVLSYTLGASTAGNASIYRDGASAPWKSVSPPNGSVTDLNPQPGIHTYTLRDGNSTGNTQTSRVVVRINSVVPQPRVITSLSKTTVRLGETIIITGTNLGNALEIDRGYFTVQIHDKNRVRHTTTGTLDPGNNSGTWTVNLPSTGMTPLPSDFTLRVGPSLNLNDISNEVNIRINP